MKKIFFDTEFSELSPSGQLLSICLMTESGDAYNASFPFDGQLNDWVQQNVVPNLPSKSFRLSEMLEFIGDDPVEFWGYAPHFDWVFFCGLFGSALDIPKNIYWLPKDWCSLAEINGLPYDTNPCALLPKTSHYGAEADTNALRLAVLKYS